MFAEELIEVVIFITSVQNSEHLLRYVALHQAAIEFFFPQ
jgi:hypothetical protein